MSKLALLGGIFIIVFSVIALLVFPIYHMALVSKIFSNGKQRLAIIRYPESLNKLDLIRFKLTCWAMMISAILLYILPVAIIIILAPNPN